MMSLKVWGFKLNTSAAETFINVNVLDWNSTLFGNEYCTFFSLASIDHISTKSHSTSRHVQTRQIFHKREKRRDDKLLKRAKVSFYVDWKISRFNGFFLELENAKSWGKKIYENIYIWLYVYKGKTFFAKTKPEKPWLRDSRFYWSCSKRKIATSEARYIRNCGTLNQVRENDDRTKCMNIERFDERSSRFVGTY